MTGLMVAEPWDIGPGRLPAGSRFPVGWLDEWNDRFPRHPCASAVAASTTPQVADLAQPPGRFGPPFPSAPSETRGPQQCEPHHRPRWLHPALTSSATTERHNEANLARATATVMPQPEPGTAVRRAPTDDSRGARPNATGGQTRAAGHAVVASGHARCYAGEATSSGHSQGGNNNAYCQDNADHLAALGPAPTKRCCSDVCAHLAGHCRCAHELPVLQSRAWWRECRRCRSCREPGRSQCRLVASLPARRLVACRLAAMAQEQRLGAAAQRRSGRPAGAGCLPSVVQSARPRCCEFHLPPGVCARRCRMQHLRRSETDTGGVPGPTLACTRMPRCLPKACCWPAAVNPLSTLDASTSHCQGHRLCPSITLPIHAV